MKTIFMRVAVGAVAAGLVGGIAVAQNQNMEEVTVEGTRMVTTKVVGKTSSGIPISTVSLSYDVSVRGLDLASQAGFMEAEKRVKDVAETACKELVRLSGCNAERCGVRQGGCRQGNGRGKRVGCEGKQSVRQVGSRQRADWPCIPRNKGR